MGIITSRPEAQQEKAIKNLKHVKLPIFYILPFGQGIYVLSERFLVFDSEVVQEGFVVVLGGEAGVAEEFADVVPFAEAAVVEHL